MWPTITSLLELNWLLFFIYKHFKIQLFMKNNGNIYEWTVWHKQNVYLMQVSTFSWQLSFKWWLYFGFLQSFVIKYTDISDKHTASIFRVTSPCDSVGKVKKSKENCITLNMETQSSFKMTKTTPLFTQHHILEGFHHCNTTQIPH